MPTKYDYVNEVDNSTLANATGDNAITATVNKDSGYPLSYDADFTASDEEHDQVILNKKSSTLNVTLDPSKLREGWTATFRDYNYNGFSFNVDGSNFDGTVNKVGTAPGDGGVEVTHLVPGEFFISEV